MNVYYTNYISFPSSHLIKYLIKSNKRKKCVKKCVLQGIGKSNAVI